MFRASPPPRTLRLAMSNRSETVQLERRACRGFFVVRHLRPTRRPVYYGSKTRPPAPTAISLSLPHKPTGGGIAVADLFSKTEVLLGRHHTNGVGVALAAAPALDANNVVALVDDAELEAVRDTPLETAVDILLPDLHVEVRLLLGEQEGPDTPVQVRVPRGARVTGDHQDGANRAVLGNETSGVATAKQSVSAGLAESRGDI